MGEPYRDVGQSSADGAHRDATHRHVTLRADAAPRALRAASRIRGGPVCAVSAILKLRDAEPT